jgi:hypothetical protein
VYDCNIVGGLLVLSFSAAVCLLHIDTVDLKYVHRRLQPSEVAGPFPICAAVCLLCI